MKLSLQNRFTDALPGDPILDTTRRQVRGACYSFVKPKKVPEAQIIHVIPEVLEKLGLSLKDSQSESFLKLMTGDEIGEGSKPFAMCYGGHQFGQWAGQLGDGRAINLGTVIYENTALELQLKGSGPTPYSRSADGLAVLRSSIREYLCSEAMFHLGVPTTRALILALSGDQVMRDMLYDGNPAYEKGAIVARVSPSFLRFGSYEILAAQGDIQTLKTLIDFTIQTHFKGLGIPSKSSYLAFFKTITESTLKMVVEWQRVGFVHGVMNTDNMSILGLTIDYGPYGWLEDYDPDWTPNTTDSSNRRYRYGQQAQVALWNLYQLANALFPLIENAEAMEEILDSYHPDYEVAALEMMRAKLGLIQQKPIDSDLISVLEMNLQLTETDMTLFFRMLSGFKKSEANQGFHLVFDAFYQPEAIDKKVKEQWQNWFESYAKRLDDELISEQERAVRMNAVNPKYVLRNYMSQLAIDAADKGDYSLINELYLLLKKPYDEQPQYEKWFAKRPEWARNKAGCSMLSCSS